MIFGHFLLDVNESNAFAVGCEETRDALLVDGAEWDPRIPAFLDEHQLTLKVILITHDHFDHTGGLEDALAATQATAYSGSGRAGGRTVQRLSHGDTIQFGKIEGRIVATPGHTPESISLILPGMAFTGDALFSGSIGGTTSPANAKEEVQAIRDHIFTLPGDYQIHTGHGPSSTVAIERDHNPFFC